MKNSLKKIISLVLVLVVSLAISVPGFAAEKEDNVDYQRKTQALSLNNELIKNILESKDIDVIVTSDNKIKLAKTDPKSIEKANKILQSVQKSYPTAWVHMGANDIISSKKIRAATRVAFTTALSTWIKQKVPDPKAIVAAAAIAYGSYWFNNIEEEDVYYFAQYYYREIGPGKIDGGGNFIGDYEIRKIERTTKNSSNSGGQTATTIKKSSVLDPWF